MHGARRERALHDGAAVPTPLATWLGGMTRATFRAEHLRRAPLARAGSALDYSAAFTWDDLDEILRHDPPADVLVVARGERRPLPVPRSLAECRALMAQGIGLAMRRNERCHEGLAVLAEALAADLGGTPHVQLFATPGGTHGFGWHYDDEDVFIVQTAGVKDYYFRANTVAPSVSASDAGVFQRFADESSPLCTACLVPGDFLYLPSRWWHMATCREDALSISIGMDLG